jgi:hypothetical protein
MHASTDSDVDDFPFVTAQVFMPLADSGVITSPLHQFGFDGHFFPLHCAP